MALTRGTTLLSRKRTREESQGQCYDSSHLNIIADLKRQVLELKKSQDLDREQTIAAPLRGPVSSSVRVTHKEGEGRSALGPGGDVRQRQTRGFDSPLKRCPRSRAARAPVV
ncbi:hypothetical protein KUCAC02_008239 [Chaenocephalus aceratus]|uniref:Uncharacterized protein n=1 Tax=Chaenocephalus aceratus TaxID=36190 RepID=A0ACB9X8S4_CHAAC|nr:hypothetical protein KUCAC02_008239 [Chaenocephalus aceratus]